VLLDLIVSRAAVRGSEITRRLWDCDSDAAVAAISAGLAELRSQDPD
jgi:hypothetical protein